MNNNSNEYGLPDLRHLVATRTHFPVTSQTSDTFLLHHNMAAAATQPQYEQHIMVGTEFFPHKYVGYDHSSATNNVATTTATNINTSASAINSIDQGIWPANDGGNSRWPRQETLTLLEIRSRLNSNFKEANQKGYLWDEVSRIMAEEHGYQRSGKKCREKFENLYKYYKKTKEGKAGRHDGKHYRFFRQLEAICGETSNNNNQTIACATAIQPSLSTAPRSNILKQETQDDLKRCESTLSLSSSSEFDTSSSENNDELSAIVFMVKQSMENKNMSREEGNHKRGKKSWKAKAKEFIDSQMGKIMETQEAWMEKTMKIIEDKEQERILKEQEWRKQEEAKLNSEHEFWARERAWLEARDAALMEALKKFTGKGLQLFSSTEAMQETQENNSEDICINDNVGSNRWTEPELSTLLQLKTSMDLRYHESEYIKEGIWEDISAKIASLGYAKSPHECKHKWETINLYFNMASESNKKRKEVLRTGNYFHHSNVINGTDEVSIKNQDDGIRFQLNGNEHEIASSSQVHQSNSLQHIMMNGEGHWWGNCDSSLNKEKNQHG